MQAREAAERRGRRSRISSPISKGSLLKGLGWIGREGGSGVLGQGTGLLGIVFTWILENMLLRNPDKLILSLLFPTVALQEGMRGILL